jgi:photosystem II stability/assembly factor-like uncharacterized protein
MIRTYSILLFIATTAFTGRAFAQHGPAQGWTISKPFDSNTVAWSLAFGSPKIGYAWGTFAHFSNDTGLVNVEELRLFKTTDSGLTWNRIIKRDVANPSPSYVILPDTSAIYLIEQFSASLTRITRTLDGGLSWGNWKIGYSPRYIAMFDRSTGIFDFVDSDGNVATDMTYDSLKTLVDPRVGGEYLYYLGAANSEIRGDWSDTLHWCYAIRSGIGNVFPIVFTTDGGHNWTDVLPDSSMDHNVHNDRVEYLRGTPLVWVLAKDSAASYYVSSDYGASWRGSTAYANLIKKIVPVTPSEAWAIANSGKGADSMRTQFLLHTTDTGATWQVDSEIFRGYWAADMFFTDARHGWVVLNKNDSIITTARYVGSDTTLSVNLPNVPAKLLAVYPNPAGNELQIFGAKPGTLRLFDLLGREVLTQVSNSSEYTLDVSAIPEGTYIIRSGVQAVKVEIVH